MSPEYFGPDVPWKDVFVDRFDISKKLKICNAQTAIDVGCGLLSSPIFKAINVIIHSYH